MINKKYSIINVIIIDLIVLIIISVTVISLQLQINKLKVNNDQKDLIEQIGRLKEKSEKLNKEIELQQLNNIALQKEKWGLEQELSSLTD